MKGRRWLVVGLVLWLVSVWLAPGTAAQDEEGCCVYKTGLTRVCVQSGKSDCENIFKGTFTAGGICCDGKCCKAGETCCDKKCCPPAQSCQGGACVVPEPATIVLATVGFGAIGLWARRQRRRRGHQEGEQ